MQCSKHVHGRLFASARWSLRRRGGEPRDPCARSSRVASSSAPPARPTVGMELIRHLGSYRLGWCCLWPFCLSDDAVAQSLSIRARLSPKAFFARLDRLCGAVLGHANISSPDMQNSRLRGPRHPTFPVSRVPSYAHPDSAQKVREKCQLSPRRC